MPNKYRGKDLVIAGNKPAPVSTPEEEEKMIKAWLKKNKPSKKFKDEPKVTHVTPKSSLGEATTVGGQKVW